MSKEIFCKILTEKWGENIDNPKQVSCWIEGEEIFDIAKQYANEKEKLKVGIMKKKNFIIRLIASPFVLGLILISYLRGAFMRWIEFLKWGGEFSQYKADDAVTIQKIYEELKEQRK